MIALAIALFLAGAFVLWMLNALVSLDRNPHGGMPEERCEAHWSCSRVCERGTKGCKVQHKEWKEGYED